MGVNQIIKVGNNIKRYRKQLNLTQSQMADNLNIPRSTYANYENNTREPSLEMLNKIAKTLGITTNLLIGKENTATQEILDELITKEIPLEQISKETGIPTDEINAVCNNTGDFSSASIMKIGRYIGVTNQQIIKWIAQGQYNYNLTEIMSNYLYNNKTTLTQSKLDNDDYNINQFKIFLLKCSSLPLEKLDNKAICYLFEKVTDTLEFEFYKLKKNDYKVSSNEK